MHFIRHLGFLDLVRSHGRGSDGRLYVNWSSCVYSADRVLRECRVILPALIHDSAVRYSLTLSFCTLSGCVECPRFS